MVYEESISEIRLWALKYAQQPMQENVTEEAIKMISKTEKALFLINNWRKMFIEYTSKIFHNPVPAKAGIMTDVKWRVFLQWKRNGKWCRWKLSFGITVLSICKIFNKRSKNFALFWKTYVNFIIWLHCTKCLQKMQQYLYINKKIYRICMKNADCFIVSVQRSSACPGRSILCILLFEGDRNLSLYALNAEMVKM